MRDRLLSAQLATAILATSAWCQAGPSDVLVGSSDGIELHQVDFSIAPMPLVDSTFGVLEADPLQLLASTGMSSGYLNLAVVGKLAHYVPSRDVTPPLRWAVRNLYVQTQTTLDHPQVIRDLFVTFPDQPQIVSTYFDLGIEGRQEDVTRLRAYLLYSSRPVPSLLDLMMRIPSVAPTGFPVTALTEITVGDVDPMDCTPDISDPGFRPLPPAPLQPFASSFWVSLPNPVNVEAAQNQCGPIAWANCLQFFEETYGIPYAFSVPEPHVPGLLGDNTLVGVLESYMNRSVTDRCVGSGTNRCNFGMNDVPSRIPGLMDYLSNTFDITRFQMRHQGREAVFPDECIGTFSFGIQSVREAPEPTWEWIRDRITEGYAVVIAYGRYSSVVTPSCSLQTLRTGGHILRVYQVGSILGQRWIGALDDGYQDGLENDVCHLHGGLRNDILWWVEDVDNDGRLNLSGADWEIELAVALRLLPPPG